MKVDLGAEDRQVLEWSKQQNAAGPLSAVEFYGGLEQGSNAQQRVSCLLLSCVAPSFWISLGLCLYVLCTLSVLVESALSKFLFLFFPFLSAACVLLLVSPTCRVQIANSLTNSLVPF